MSVRLLSLLLVAAGALLGASTAAPWPLGQQRWVITDLGTFGGDYGEASAINSHGEIVGYAAIRSKDKFGYEISHAFLWQDGRMRDLEVSPRGFSTNAAVAINDNGQILGVSYRYERAFSQERTAETRLWLWENGKLIRIGKFAGRVKPALNERGQVIGPNFVWESGKLTKLDFVPSAINDRGDIVGTVGDAQDVLAMHAVLREHGKMRDLLKAPSAAVAINNRGEILISNSPMGYDYGHERAYLWRSGKLTDLGTLGGKATRARAINDRGQILGTSTYSPTSLTEHTFLWQAGHMTDLTPHDRIGGNKASAMNYSGQIIGQGDHGPYVWKDGKTTRLTGLAGEPATSAVAIDNNGRIVGSSNARQGVHAVLWTLRPAS